MQLAEFNIIVFGFGFAYIKNITIISLVLNSVEFNKLHCVACLKAVSHDASC